MSGYESFDKSTATPPQQTQQPYASPAAQGDSYGAFNHSSNQTPQPSAPSPSETSAPSPPNDMYAAFGNTTPVPASSVLEPVPSRVASTPDIADNKRPNTTTAAANAGDSYDPFHTVPTTSTGYENNFPTSAPVLLNSKSSEAKRVAIAAITIIPTPAVNRTGSFVPAQAEEKWTPLSSEECMACSQKRFAHPTPIQNFCEKHLLELESAGIRREKLRRDFNALFQGLEENLATNLAEENERRQKLVDLLEEYKDFCRNCVLFIQNKPHFIQPVGGGRLGGEKYVYGHVLFKHAAGNEDARKLFATLIHGSGWDPIEAAQKAALDEVRAQSAVVTSDFPQLHVTFTVIIRVAGECMIGTALAPIKSDTLVMGTGDGGRTVRADRASMNRLAGELATIFNLAPHEVPVSQGGGSVPTVTIYFGADVEGHVSAENGQHYLVDLGRFFPPRTPKTATFQQFRGEYLRLRAMKNSPPLSVDAFLAFGRVNGEKHNDHVTNTFNSEFCGTHATLLADKIFTRVAQFYTTFKAQNHFKGLLHAAQHAWSLADRARSEICAYFHSKDFGMNMSMLGHVLNILVQNAKADQSCLQIAYSGVTAAHVDEFDRKVISAAVRFLIVSEIVVRTAKEIFRRRCRKQESTHMQETVEHRGARVALDIIREARPQSDQVPFVCTPFWDEVMNISRIKFPQNAMIASDADRAYIIEQDCAAIANHAAEDHPPVPHQTFLFRFLSGIGATVETESDDEADAEDVVGVARELAVSTGAVMNKLIVRPVVRTIAVHPVSNTDEAERRLLSELALRRANLPADRQGELLKTFNELMRAYTLYLPPGKAQSALDAAEEMCALALAEGVYSPIIVRSFTLCCQLYLMLNQPTKALQMIDHATDCVNRLTTDSQDNQEYKTAELASLRVFRGEYFEKTGNLKEAKHQYEMVLVTRRSLKAQNELQIADTLLRLSRVQQLLAEFAEAYKGQNEAKEIIKSKATTKSPEYASILLYMGSLARISGDKPDLALALHRDALQIRQDYYGAQNAFVAEAATEFGLSLQAKGEREDALRYLKHALTVMAAIRGEDSADVARCYENLTRFFIELDTTGLKGEAREYLEKAELIRRRDYSRGVSGRDLALNLILRAQLLLLIADKDFGEAEKHCNEAIELLGKEFSGPHYDIAMAKFRKALVFKKQRKNDDALALLDEVLNMRLEVYKDQDEKHRNLEIPLSVQTIADVLLNRGQSGDYPAAEKRAKEALAMVEHRADHSDVAKIVESVGVLLKRISPGNSEEARKLYERALAIRKRILNENHPAIAETLNNIGLLYKQMYDYPNSAQNLQEALNRQRAFNSTETANLAEAHGNLGMVLGELGKHSEAEEALQRGLDIRIKVLGPNSDNVAHSKTSLAVHLTRRGQPDDFARADQLFTDAYKIFRGQREKATLLGFWIRLLRVTGRWADALQICEELIVLRKELRVKKDDKPKDAPAENKEKEYMPPSLEDAGALAFKAEVLLASDALEAAAATQSELDAMMTVIRSGKMKDADPHLSKIDFVTGMVKLRTGNFADAKKALESAFEIRSRLFKFVPNHADLAEAEDALGLLSLKLKEYPSALTKVEDARNRRARFFGTPSMEALAELPQHYEIANSLEHLGWIYLETGKSSESAQALQSALAIRQKLFGEHHTQARLFKF